MDNSKIIRHVCEQKAFYVYRVYILNLNSNM